MIQPCHGVNFSAPCHGRSKRFPCNEAADRRVRRRWPRRGPAKDPNIWFASEKLFQATVNRKVQNQDMEFMIYDL